MHKNTETAINEFMEIGPRIKRARTLKKITLDDFSPRVEMSKATISKIENGKQAFSVKQLIRIAHALDVGVDDLLGRNPHVLNTMSDVTTLSVYSNFTVTEEGEVLRKFHADHAVPLAELGDASSYRHAFFYLYPTDNADAGIRKNDLLLIEECAEYNDNDLVLASAHGYETTIVKYYAFGQSLVLSEIGLSGKHYKIKPSKREKVKILGKVIKIERKL